jgi:hypothetical protein
MVREQLLLLLLATAVPLACGGETFRRERDRDDAGEGGSDSGGASGKAGGGSSGTGSGMAGSGNAGFGPGGSGGSGGGDGGTGMSQGGSQAAGSAGTVSGAAGDPNPSEGGEAGTTGGGGGTAGTGGSGGLPIVDPQPGPGAAQDLPSGDTLNSTPPVVVALGDGVVIAGYTRDPAFLGLQAFEEGHVAEVFAARLDHAGQVLWTTLLPGSAIPSEIALDPQGDIVIVAPYLADRQFTIYMGSSTNDLYVAKLRPTGDIVYARDIPFDSSTIPYGMTVAPDGSIYVVGGCQNPDMSNNFFALLAKYDADGNESWTKKFVHTGTWASADGVAVLANGDVAITGGFNGTIDFGGQPLTTEAVYETYSMSNGFLATFAPNGDHLGSARFGGDIFDRGTDLVALSDGDLLLAGQISGIVTLGGKTAEGHDGEGSPFVARLDPTGTADWFEVAAARGLPYDLEVDPDEGLIHLAGFFSGNHFLFEFGPNGEHALAATVPGTDIWSYSLAVDSTRSLWLSGAYRYDVDFGAGAAFMAEDRGVFLVRLERQTP